jgi:type VI secretion system protein ImpH
MDATPVSEALAQQRRQAHEAWLAAVTASPFKFDFYQALRRMASAYPQLPPLGEALRPKDEPVRVGEPAELDFAPAPLHRIENSPGRPPRLLQRVFGLLGPNGALPLHLTEYTRERTTHHNDVTLQRFLDTLTHRFALLFYRAWAEAQLTVSLDRPGSKTIYNRVGALVGIGLPSLQDRDALSDASRLNFVGRLSRQARDADGLLAWLRSEFAVPVAIEQWRGHWMQLAVGDRSRLGRRIGAQLGRDTVLGSQVWDVQHKFRITVGPLRLDEYRQFLPGGPHLARLLAMVRHWVGLEFEWDLKLALRREEIPLSLLGTGGTTLGYTTWLGCARRTRDPDDLCLDVERVAMRRRVPERAARNAEGDRRQPRQESAAAAKQGEPA